MSDSEKQIQDWQHKVRETFGDESKLYEYLFQTLENFFYRYLETSLHSGLKVKELEPKVYGTMSFENNMVNALKVTDPEIKYGIMDLAKRIPKAQNPQVRYTLKVHIKEMTADRGHLTLTAETNWGWPDWTSSESKKKVIEFKYQELNEYRKNLALKLEEVCSIFL